MNFKGLKSVDKSITLTLTINVVFMSVLHYVTRLKRTAVYYMSYCTAVGCSNVLLT